MPHRVVIVGGGFGGLYAAKAFAGVPDVEVTVVDKRNFHLFQPLLYQVATGGLSPGDIASPLRAVLSRQKNTRVVMGEVTGLDPGTRRLMLARGELAYDSLIVAAGSSHSYFGHDEWAETAPSLKTIEDATEIRRKIFLAFEAAERESNSDKRREWLTFVVVGAGPTGVELAGALSAIARDALKGDFRVIRPEESQILLVDAGPRVLPSYPPDLSDAAERQLVGLGVRSITGARVTGVTPEGVWLDSAGGRAMIRSRTVLWAAGVQASPLGRILAARTAAEVDRQGRVIVAPDLSVPGYPEVFVIGDLARVDQDGQPLPGVAPVAMQQGRYVAKVILNRIGVSSRWKRRWSHLLHPSRRAAYARKAPPPPFHYRNKGSLATIGRAAAVADFGFARFTGWFAWVLWLFVHLLYLVGFQNRLVVLIQWAFEYFTFNRGARLITGPIPPLPELADPGPESERSRFANQE